MEIDLLKKHWEAFSRDDPLWAVLTDSSRVGRGWDLEEFLATGEREVAGYLDELERLGAAPVGGRALDFGCGVGRLTQALAERFEHCDGVDIAEPMIAEARRINRRAERVDYHVNDAPNLELFAGESFDFVLSSIVLQHMEPRYARGYMAEFVRVLKPGGLALFQVPAGMRTPPPAPLPEGAFRASIALEEAAPRELVALEQTLLQVRVRNESPHTWPVGSRVRLGNHWVDARGQPLAVNDGRSEIDTELRPGAEVTLGLLVRAPPLAGRHTLELDLVQEQVTWFVHRGSPVVRLAVNVRGGEGDRAATAADTGSATTELFTPIMEMYSVPPGDVRDTVIDAGGEVLHELPDENAGSEFESYHYVVRRVAKRRPAVPRQSLTHLRAAIASVPDRTDMLPPIVSRRHGRTARLELRVKQELARATRWFTWAQSEHDRAVLRALSEARGALEEQDAELRRLREELTRLQDEPGGP